MGSEDTPDNLSPAEREQYYRYAEGKYSRGETPRTPMEWREVSAALRAGWWAGKAVQLGLGKIYDLKGLGAQPEVTVKAGEQTIRVDWRIPQRDLVVAINIETKGGRFDQQRDLTQLRGYAQLLREGQQVVYFIRAEKEPKLSKEMRDLLVQLEQQYPNSFTVQRASEKVFARILAAGVRELREQEQQRLQENVAKLPPREAAALSVEQIAKDYLAEISRAREEGREIGIDQLRYIVPTLQDLAAAELKLDLEKADKDREALGLRYHESKAVEQYLELKARDQHGERMSPVNMITHELLDRERAELAKTAAEIHAHIEQARIEGKALDLEALRKDHLALANTLGAVQAIETQLFNDVADNSVQRGLPEYEAHDWLRAMGTIQEERDLNTQKQIDAIAAVAEREEKAREDALAAAEKAQREAEQRAAYRRDIDRLPPEVAKLLEAGQAQPPTAAVNRDPNIASPQVQRGGRHAQGQERGLERGR
ncbi:hypothetical protein [Nocardia asiatica]|uniref:hypothetical protein n=1 Tax=Nocardia asiatica TaxID=209252 RepID=UPI0024564F98|nr:hypothetical protein [Nocardia asiatica]